MRVNRSSRKYWSAEEEAQVRELMRTCRNVTEIADFVKEHLSTRSFRAIERQIEVWKLRPSTSLKNSLAALRRAEQAENDKIRDQIEGTESQSAAAAAAVATVGKEAASEKVELTEEEILTKIVVERRKRLNDEVALRRKELEALKQEFAARMVTAEDATLTAEIALEEFEKKFGGL